MQERATKKGFISDISPFNNLISICQISLILMFSSNQICLEKIMFNNSKPSTKEELLVFLVTVTIAVTICGSAVLGFSILCKECSRMFATPSIHPSSWLW